MEKIWRKKIWPEFFEPIDDGRKTFEVRKLDDGFQPDAGDGLVLEEWEPETKRYTGRAVFRHITYILNDVRFLPTGTVVLGLRTSSNQDTTAELVELRERLRSMIDTTLQAFREQNDKIGALEQALKESAEEKTRMQARIDELSTLPYKAPDRAATRGCRP